MIIALRYSSKVLMLLFLLSACVPHNTNNKNMTNGPLSAEGEIASLTTITSSSCVGCINQRYSLVQETINGASRGMILNKANNQKVNLFGVNYYPMSTLTHYNMDLAGLKTLAQQKEEIDKDLNDLSFLWVNFIRVHVFDREISDASGNLIDNKHLDLLEYLLYKCSLRGISVMLTPIAWFHSPYEQNHYSDANKRAFSVLWNKKSFIVGGMQTIPSELTKIASPQGGVLTDSTLPLWNRQDRFFKQFLSKVNRYSKYAIGHEPSLGMIEIINEPEFWNYKELLKAKEGNYSYEAIPDDLKYFYNRDKARDIKLVVYDYEKHLSYTKKADTVSEYKNFLYWRTKDYVNKMTNTIKGNSHSSMLVAHSLHGAEYWGYGNDIEGDIRKLYLSAVADSSIDLLTAGSYPGGMNAHR